MDYAFCIDEETWRKDYDNPITSEVGAIRRAIEYANEDDDPLVVGQEIMIGESSPMSIKSFISATDIIDQMNERAYDECGDWAEDYPDLTKDEIAELDKLLSDFFAKHAPCNFWTVGEPITHIITQDDLESHDGQE